ncbi:transposase [Verminephrobacter eiseniae]|uniref:transposase n=1 Tax=Verminephrobacter eiseniae TaxID=364317 RepID=UPI002237AB50|nr:transposase [Verminephrobacter eiseniae]
MPRAWAEDPIGQQEGSKKAGVPKDITLATKPQIALQQIRSLLQPGAPRHWVLADAGYGIDSAFRQGLTDRGLAYVVAITRAVVVWPPACNPCHPNRTVARVARPCGPGPRCRGVVRAGIWACGMGRCASPGSRFPVE